MYFPLDGPGLNKSITVTSTPIELKVGATALDGRKVVTAQAIDGEIYYGYSSSVTASAGANAGSKVFEGQLLLLECTYKLPIYLVSEGSVEVRITEVA